MSKYEVFEDVKFRNKDLLLRALQKTWTPEQIIQGERLNLYGYHGDIRKETAEIVIRRQHVQRAANDIGFTLTDDGYVPIVSEYDASSFQDGKFLTNLRVAYGEAVVQTVAKRLRGSVSSRQEGSILKMQVRW